MTFLHFTADVTELSVFLLFTWTNSNKFSWLATILSAD